MSYSISWIALHGIEKRAVYDRIGFITTGEVSDRDDFEVSGRTLASGWTVIFFGQTTNHPLLRACDRLSRGCRLIACVVKEDDEWIGIQSWQNGKWQWQVVHDSERSPYHLKADGVLPPQLHSIDIEYRARQFRETQPSGYVSEIPLVLAQAITSFRHNQSQSDEEEFEELEPKSR